MTGSFWCAAVPMAAAIATLQKLHATDARRAHDAAGRAAARRASRRRRGGTASACARPARCRCPWCCSTTIPTSRRAIAFAARRCAHGVYLHPLAQHVPVARARRGRDRPGAGGDRPRRSPRSPKDTAERSGRRLSLGRVRERAYRQAARGRCYDMAVTTAARTSGHGHNATPEFLADRARFVRLETVRLTRIAGAGHYSSTFSAAELFAALYYAHLRIDPARPDWPDRDRFILSKGHAAIGLYPVLADLGFFEPALLDDYTRLGSPFGDHPDMKKIKGVDFSSGSLGHGLSIGVGMALAGRVAAARLSGLLHAGRRRTARGSDLGGGDGGEPFPAAGPGRHRRPQRPVHRRPHRGHHGGRADRRALPQLRLGGPAHRRPRPRCDPRRARRPRSRRASARRR